MNRLSTTVMLFLFAQAPVARAQDTPAVEPPPRSRIRQVTLYRDRALVTREIVVPAAAALRSIDVPDLPELIVADSVFAEGDDTITIRGVRVSGVPAVESRREEVQALDQQIESMTRQRTETEQMLDVINKDIDSLDQLVNFSAAKGNADLNHGVLNAETLTTLSTFSMSQRRDLAHQQFQYQMQLADLNGRLELATGQRSQATKAEQSMVYQAKIFAETAEGEEALLRLSYMVGGCGWSPQYTVRGRLDQPSFELRYSAVVQQMSGENWDNVSLILSTSSPSVSAARPLLTPLRIVTVDPVSAGAGAAPAGTPGDPFAASPLTDPAADLSQSIQALRLQQRDAEAELASEPSAAGSTRRDLALNSLAGKMQQIELQAQSKSWQTLAPDVSEDIASQVYTLSQPVSLDTRREQQLVQIAEAQLEGEMFHVATPLLSTYAYREAEMTNTQPFGLLGGPAAVYLDDRFVGRTEIPSTASGQRLTIGFGADQQVRTRRELVDKQDAIQGGNRRLTFVYRLVLANFKGQRIAIRLFDRMPITRQEQQLSVSLDAPGQPLSDDALYQRVLRPNGLLRWDVTLPEDRHGSKAFDIQYSYSMAFDRSRIPATQDMLSEMQADYRDMSLPAGGMGGMGGMGMGGGGN